MFKKSNCVVLLVCFILLICFILSGCGRSTPTLSASEMSSPMPDAAGDITSPVLSPSKEPSMTSDVGSDTTNLPSSPSAEDEFEDIISNIDERVSWIDEHKGLSDGNFGDFDHIKGEIYTDYYDDESLVYREGVEEYYEVIEGGVFYRLYYDDEDRLTYAYVIQYRAPSYHI